MTAAADPLKLKVAEAVDRLADELEGLSHRIHATPELAFKEEQAHAWLTGFLEQHGARVERGVGGLPTAFSRKIGTSFAEIADGTSYTLMVAEARRDIPWTKPDDILFDPEKDPPALGGYFKDGFHVGMCDGSARFLTPKTDAKTLKLLIMPQDGNPIPELK